MSPVGFNSFTVDFPTISDQAFSEIILNNINQDVLLRKMARNVKGEVMSGKAVITEGAMLRMTI